MCYKVVTTVEVVVCGIIPMIRSLPVTMIRHENQIPGTCLHIYGVTHTHTHKGQDTVIEQSRSLLDKKPMELQFSGPKPKTTVHGFHR